MNCIECRARVDPQEDYVELPSHEVLCEQCSEEILDKPPLTEWSGEKTQSSETVNKAWLI